MEQQVVDTMDNSVRRMEDIPEPPIGLTRLDVLRKMGGPSFLREYRIRPYHSQTNRFRVEQGHILVDGAAVMQCSDTLVRHVSIYRAGSSVGFIADYLENDRVLVHVKGIVTLRIPAITQADFGKTVFATGPNEFNLESGVRIGRVVNCPESGKAHVLFTKGGSIEDRDWNDAVSLYRR